MKNENVAGELIILGHVAQVLVKEYPSVHEVSWPESVGGKLAGQWAQGAQSGALGPDTQQLCDSDGSLPLGGLPEL